MSSSRGWGARLLQRHWWEGWAGRRMKDHPGVVAALQQGLAPKKESVRETREGLATQAGGSEGAEVWPTVKSPTSLARAGEGSKVSKVTQSCPTLCGPMDCSLPGSSVHGIFQARVLEWVAISFSRGIFSTRGVEMEIKEEISKGSSG